MAKIDIIFMRTKLFARCRCKKIVEVEIFKASGKFFRIYGTCPYCLRDINRPAFKYDKVEH